MTRLQKKCVASVKKSSKTLADIMLQARKTYREEEVHLALLCLVKMGWLRKEGDTYHFHGKPKSDDENRRRALRAFARI